MKIICKTDEEIEKIEVAGKMSYDILMNLKSIIKKGITTRQIDDYVNAYIKKRKCIPAFLNYEGFPSSCCISVNDMVVHGIPSTYKLKDGDIVSVDLGVIYKGYYSDTAYTYIVGTTTKEVEEFVINTQKALYKGLSLIKDGVCLNDICKAIESIAVENGYGVVKELTGHGVGLSLHEEPYIPNYSNEDSKSIYLHSGNVIAIEPMFTIGSEKIRLHSDGWGISTIDKSLASHFEHTVLVTTSGYRILTGE
ncbi:MAG: type I methionyl aminopeptidase [Bacilli bacterium]